MISKPKTRPVAARFTCAPVSAPRPRSWRLDGDAAQDLGEVRAGAAAGVEDVDVVGGQAVGDAQVVLQGAVDAGDHVAHHLGGGVPDAKLLAEGGVEGLQEGLVEVWDGLALAEPVEEGVAVDAVQGSGGPVQHLDESQGLEATGVGQLLEERPEHGCAEVPDCFMPVETASRRRRLPCPEHPRGEDAVEEGLDEGGAEEGRAAISLEPDAEGLLQRRAHGPERGRVACRLDTGQAVAGVGGE